MKAILLVRVSTEQQELDEQTLSLKNYAITKGYKESDLYLIEDKESAIKLSEDERNGLVRMKEIASTDKDVNAVFIWELSRLTRVPRTAYSLRDFFINNQIQLYCYSPTFQLLNDDLKNINSQGSMTFAIFIELAEAEMRNKKERFHRSKIRNARTGKYSGGFVKYGYFVNDAGYYEIEKQQAEFIQYIFNEYEKGKSIFKLTKELLERGKIKTQNFVRNTLISDCYTGLSDKYNMQRAYPQIISKEQFERCRQLARENNKKADKALEVYYCKNLIKCPECGTHYIAMKSSGVYLCYGRYGREARLDKTKACKKSPVINLNFLDSLIWDIAKHQEFLYGDQNDSILMKKLNEKIETNIEIINASKEKIESLNEERERNDFRFQSNKNYKKENYQKTVADFDNQEAVINNKISKLESENFNFKQTIEELENKEKNLKSIDKHANKFQNIQEITDDLERQKICRRWIERIEILEDVPNYTKIISVHLTQGTEALFKVYIKKNPPLVEEFFHSLTEKGGLMVKRRKYLYIERFKRSKKVNKAETPLEN